MISNVLVSLFREVKGWIVKIFLSITKLYVQVINDSVLLLPKLVNYEIREQATNFVAVEIFETVKND